jgi:hypothetical protein
MPMPVATESRSMQEPATPEQIRAMLAGADQKRPDQKRPQKRSDQEKPARERPEQERLMRENDLPSFAIEAPPAPHRYRFYVGAVLAVLLAVLLYKTWHRTSSGDLGRNSSLPNAVPQEQAPTAASEPQPTGSGPLANNSAAKNPPTTTSPAKSAAAPVKQPAAISSAARKPKAAVRPNHHVAPAAARPSATAPQNGGEDFAIAQKYLRGNGGTGRNSAEAAQWLWKAVGSGSVPATVALADLYLHGDGVPKSCDQGRLLLDAAARKGSAAASERLRNLPAFGCR